MLQAPKPSKMWQAMCMAMQDMACRDMYLQQLIK